MTAGQHFFLNLPIKATRLVVESTRQEFDELLEESFSEDELSTLEGKLEQLAPVQVEELAPEISFEDFYPDPQLEQEQRTFFGSCRSIVVFERLPYLDQNPFQVSYLRMLLEKIDDCLVDLGGTQELVFKQQYLRDLESYRGVEVRKKLVPIPAPVWSPSADPVSRDLQSIKLELARIQAAGLGDKLSAKMKTVSSERTQKLMDLLKIECIDASSLLVDSGLNPKDFGDQIERIKLILKNINNL